MMYEEDSTRAVNAAESEQADNFKPVFKKYKRRDKPLDLTDVIDLDKLTADSSSDSVRRVKPVVPSLTPVVGLRPVEDWDIFEFPDHPGFYVIRNPFEAGSQRYWTARCLEDLPRSPNVTNLTVHPDLNPDTLWASFLTAFHNRGSEAYNSSSSLRKLRWTTIGYHYHWDTKEYQEEDHTAFPEDVGALAQYAAAALGFGQFRAEAGIVNYYHHDSSLAAHTDHSELDHDAPLVSISFGQDAVFLLGGLTKAQTPTALRLRSGDMCIMSAESRLAYHAVPRIMPPHLTPSSSSSSSSSSSLPQSRHSSHHHPPFSSSTPTSCSSSAQVHAPTLPSCFDMTRDDWRRVEGWAACAGLRKVPGGSTEGAPETGGATSGDTAGLVGNMLGGRRDCTEKTEKSSSFSADKDPVCASTIESICGVAASVERDTNDKCSEKNGSLSSTYKGDIPAAWNSNNSSLAFQGSVSSSVSACRDSQSSILSITHHTMLVGSDPHVDGDSISSANNATAHHTRLKGSSDVHTDNSVCIEQAQHATENTRTHSEFSDYDDSQTTTSWYEGVVKGVNRHILSTLLEKRREEDWAPFAAYLAASRLNVNIRQVLRAGHTFRDGTVGRGGEGADDVGGTGSQDSSARNQVKKARTEASQTS